MFNGCAIFVDFYSQELNENYNISNEIQFNEWKVLCSIPAKSNPSITFHIFSHENTEDQQIKITNFKLTDNKNMILSEENEQVFTLRENKYPKDCIFHDTVWFNLRLFSLDKNILKNKKYLIVEYEINGKHYIERLERKKTTTIIGW